MLNSVFNTITHTSRIIILMSNNIVQLTFISPLQFQFQFYCLLEICFAHIYTVHDNNHKIHYDVMTHYINITHL